MEIATWTQITLIVEEANLQEMSENISKRAIGLETESKLEEIPIIPISRKGITRMGDPFKSERRLARSPIGREKKGQKSEMEVDSPAESTGQSSYQNPDTMKHRRCKKSNKEIKTYTRRKYRNNKSNSEGGTEKLSSEEEENVTILLRRVLLYLNQAARRRHDGNYMSTYPYLDPQ